jgi:transglutaminase-like putative cysteine protease
MILEVQHETRLEYSESVTEAVTELRMEPVSDDDQSCHSFHLAVSPPTEMFRFHDGFTNSVHHFNVLTSHREVRILAAGVVETHPRARNLSSSDAVYPLNLDAVDLEVLGFLKFRGPVRQTPALNPVLETLRPRRGMRLAELVANTASYIRGHFQYARAVTQASSPIDDVLQQGKGVCQDFAHLMIAILRAFDVPARYVSGYIHRPNKDSQSHAWCEVWLPDLGWMGIDPTNDRIVGEPFIKVATGRDYTDVPPNKGVYRGKAEEKISVRVETRALDRLPSMSWQEQLPPLEAPLQAVLSGLSVASASNHDEDSQQQQQQ